MKNHPTELQCFLEFQRMVRELVLVIGGVCAVHPVADVVVWELARGLDGVLAKSATRLLTKAPEAVKGERPARPRPHPAIEELLRHVDAMGGPGQ